VEPLKLFPRSDLPLSASRVTGPGGHEKVSELFMNPSQIQGSAGTNFTPCPYLTLASLEQRCIFTPKSLSPYRPDLPPALLKKYGPACLLTALPFLGPRYPFVHAQPVLLFQFLNFEPPPLAPCLTKALTKYLLP